MDIEGSLAAMVQLIMGPTLAIFDFDASNNRRCLNLRSPVAWISLIGSGVETSISAKLSIASDIRLCVTCYAMISYIVLLLPEAYSRGKRQDGHFE